MCPEEQLGGSGWQHWYPDNRPDCSPGATCPFGESKVEASPRSFLVALGILGMWDGSSSAGAPSAAGWQPLGLGLPARALLRHS